MWPNLAQLGSVNVPTYLVVNSLAFCLGIFWVFKRAKWYKLDQNAALDLALLIMVSGFIGARAFHVFLEEPQFYWDHPDYIFKFWYGGFVYYGGFFAALLASSLLCLRRKYDFLAYADLFAPVAAGAYAFGRLGCLAAGCCFGRPTTLPWGIIFPWEQRPPRVSNSIPHKIYFSLWEGALCVLLLWLQRYKVFARRGQYFGLWLLLHAVGRGFLEQFRGDFRGQKFFNLSLSTWLSGLVIGLAIMILMPKPERP